MLPAQVVDPGRGTQREDAGDDQATTDANQSDKTEQKPAQIDSEFGQDAEAKRSETSEEKMLVGEEESARKQVELAVGHHPPKKPWAARLWLIAIVTMAGASWYYASQNPEKIQAVLTAVQTESSEVDENPVPSEDVAATGTDDADGNANTGEATFGAPTSFTAAAIASTDEDSTAGLTVSTTPVDAAEDSTTDLTVSTTPVDAAEDSAADPAVSTTTVDATEASITDLTDSTTTVDGAETSPELTADSTSETNGTTDALDESGDDAEVDLAENAENENAAVGMVDGEVVLTPETQRRADISKFLGEGVSLAAIGDHDAAIQKFDEAIELDAEAPFLYKQRGASFHSLGQYAAAVSDYDEAVRLNGEDVNAYYNRGASHFALQDYAATVADYDEVIRLDPELADAYSKRADAHEAMGSSEEAARDRATAAVFESNRDNPR